MFDSWSLLLLFSTLSHGAKMTSNC